MQTANMECINRLKNVVANALKTVDTKVTFKENIKEKSKKMK